MEDLYVLAAILGKMGIFNASLETDPHRLVRYRDSLESLGLFYDSRKSIGGPLGFTVEIRNVKLYINCPYLLVETISTNVKV